MGRRAHADHNGRRGLAYFAALVPKYPRIFSRHVDSFLGCDAPIGAEFTEQNAV